MSGPDALLAKLAPYRGPKGNLAFPHDQPLPLDLIGEAAEQLAAQYGWGDTPSGCPASPPPVVLAAQPLEPVSHALCAYA